MGAMLFAGIHPPTDCEAIPTLGGTSLDGNPIIGSGNTPFYEANLILHQWNDWCADEGNFPSHVTPLDFFNWCIEDEIQERYAVSSPFIWISVFKDALGNSTKPIPFKIAAHTTASTEPLQTVLNKLEEINQQLQNNNQHNRFTLVPTTTREKDEIQTVNFHHKHLTTEELATALNVQPQTIYKHYSKFNHYFGVIPNKLPNRRLAWPPNAVEQILSKSKK